MKITKLDYGIVEDRVNSYIGISGISSKQEGFKHLILDTFYPNKSISNFEIITDGSNDRGADAVHIMEDHERADIHIYNFKYRDNIRTAQKNFEETELDKVFNFVRDLFDKKTSLIEHVNRNLRDKIERIHEIFKLNKEVSVRIRLVSNGLPLIANAMQRIKDFERDYFRVVFEQIHLVSIVKEICSPQERNEACQLKAIDKQIFDRSDGDIKGIVANIDAISIINAIKDENGLGVKRYLFDKNIRVYLGDKGGYNQSIIRSAISEDNYLFWYQNNGITIVCDRVRYNKSERSPIINIENYQIINGAQTCYSLHDAYLKEPEKLENVVLLVRIYETSREDVSSRVAISTNSQARILQRDLRSNDEIQISYEQAFLRFGYFYERKKGMHYSETPEKRIDSLRLGQIIMSFTMGEPEKAKTDSDNIFGDRYGEIFRKEFSPTELLNMHFLYKLIEDYMFEDWPNLQESKIEDERRRVLKHGSFHIIYCAKLHAQKNGYDILTSTKDIQIKFVKNAIDTIIDLRKRYKSTSIYEAFRSSAFRTRIEQEFSGAQMDLFSI